MEQTVKEMGDLVDKGDFQQAAGLGNKAEVPLGLNTRDLVRHSEISRGTQSVVYKGQYENQRVAIKTAKIGKAADLDNFKLEVVVMSKLRHVPSVVSLVAARLIPPGYLLVMPYIPRDLYTKIHYDGWRPGWCLVLQLSKHLAEGLAAIHAAGILHRDIKPGNVLLDDQDLPYICDFGIAIPISELNTDDAGGSAKGRPTGGFHKRNMVGTLEYMSPETLQKQAPSEKSDVWALAVTLNELATGIFPYSDCTQENPAAHTVLEMGYGRQELAAAVATDGLLPLTRDDMPPAFAALLKACWSLQPSHRPSAQQMLQALQHMQADVADPVRQEAVAAHDFVKQEASASQVPPSTHAPQTSDRQKAAPSINSQDVHAQHDDGYRPQLTAGVFATAGLRGDDRMEDRHVIREDLEAQAGCHLLAVFDGHRGPQAAQYAAHHISQVLQHQLATGAPAQALTNSFVSLDGSFRQKQEHEWREKVRRMGAGAAGKQAWPGCTALAVLLHHNTMLVANAGDCRAVLCRKGKAMALSRDQTADVEDERHRVEAAGASVQWRVDSWRIGDAGIQVTRSIGDADLKPALTAQPEVAQHRLTAEDEFVMVASDGLWDKLSNEEAVGLVHDTVKQPTMAAQRLVTEALSRGSGDNITVIVAFLRPVGTLESVFTAGKQKHAATPTFYSTR
ncbi:TPA: hypothetical protein ACH3X1_005382 [Trebouxia sp. C0004]